MKLRISKRADHRLSALDLRDEEDFAALAERLQIADLVDLAVDGDGGLFFEMRAEARIELVERLDDAAQVSRRDLEFAHAAGVAAAEPARQGHPRGRLD